MVSWIIITVLIAIILLILKTRHMQHKIFSILIVLVILFVYITGSKLVSENKINIQSFDGLVSAGKIYFSWLVNAFHNTRTIVGNAVKMDWSTNLTAKK